MKHVKEHRTPRAIAGPELGDIELDLVKLGDIDVELVKQAGAVHDPL